MDPQSSKQIFLVESDSDLRNQIAGMLNDLHYETSAFSSLDELKKSKIKKTPNLFLSSSKQGLPKEMGQCPTLKLSMGMEMEDLLESIEKAIGLPPLGNGKMEIKEEQIPNKKEAELKKEVESLLEQVAFYQRQLDQVSVVGEKEGREIDQILKDLQDDLDKTKEENISIKDELKLLKSDISKKDRELSQKTTDLSQIREETVQENQQLKEELEDLRKKSEDTKEQHKKAQNALREYYKGKVDKQTNLKSVVSDLEKKLKEAEEISSSTQKKLEEKNSLIEQLETEVQSEKTKAKKAREALQQLTKAFE